MSPSRTDVVIVGAGQAGLAMSKCLGDLGIEHVLLERSQVASAWHDRRWDSLRLLTPNWMTRLPGYRYEGADPDGFMNAAEVAAFLDGYARSFRAPIVTGTSVTSINSSDDGYTVNADTGTWQARAVVLATGESNRPHTPSVASALPRSLHQMPAAEYQNPGSVDGPVLVVGASASGVQIADELARNERDVTIAVGDHVRAVRSYRGMDLFWWLEATGRMSEGVADVEDVTRARSLPSFQVGGSGREVDLNHLMAVGVQPVGRLVGTTATSLQFSGSLANFSLSADLKLGRMLDEFDTYASANGLDKEIDGPSRPRRTHISDPVTSLPLDRFGHVIWATGYRPHYPWLEDDLLDDKGAIAHSGGLMRRPGLYVLGLQFLRTRKSSFIDGVGADALALSRHVRSYLDQMATRAGASRR